MGGGSCDAEYIGRGGSKVGGGSEAGGGRDGDSGGGDAESYSSFGGRSSGGGGYGGGRESNDAKLYVGNLNFDTTEVRLLVLFSFAFVYAGKLMKLLHFCCSTEYCP